MTIKLGLPYSPVTQTTSVPVVGPRACVHCQELLDTLGRDPRTSSSRWLQNIPPPSGPRHTTSTVLAPAPGFEPGTARLTVGSSAVELRRITSTFTITVHDSASSQMRIAIAGRVTEIDRPLRVNITQGGYTPRDVRSVESAASTRSRTTGSDESTPESKTTDQRNAVSPGTRRATKRAPRSPSTAT